nr:NADH dehydrogenase subunit 4L [Ptenopus garrulus]
MTTMHFLTTLPFSLGLLGLALNRVHLISALLCIEGLMLALFMSLTTLPQTLSLTNPYIMPITLLTMAACGAGTGLALLVATTRTHASDHLNTMNLLQC